MSRVFYALQKRAVDKWCNYKTNHIMRTLYNISEVILSIVHIIIKAACLRDSLPENKRCVKLYIGIYFEALE